jgi:hypothetical protein
MRSTDTLYRWLCIGPRSWLDLTSLCAAAGLLLSACNVAKGDIGRITILSERVPIARIDAHDGRALQLWIDYQMQCLVAYAWPRTGYWNPMLGASDLYPTLGEPKPYIPGVPLPADGLDGRRDS